MKNLDIHTAVMTALVLAIAAGAISFYLGWQSIRSGARLPFFRKRRDRMLAGWRMVFYALILGGAAFFLSRYAEPVVYHFYPPTPTITLTTTITTTPTISLTPTTTITPTITNTPSVTDTPALPLAIVTAITSVVTPNLNAVISPLSFSQKIDASNKAINPAKEFTNPVGHLFATFSFDKMTKGMQWSALWYRDGVLVYSESYPWTGGSGGYGYTDWNPPAADWQPGNYEVQIFVGTDWWQSGRFKVTGTAPTNTITLSLAPSAILTRTPQASLNFTLTPNKATPTP